MSGNQTGGRKLTLTRGTRKDGTPKNGESDTFTARIDGLLPGIGKSRVESIGSLVSANLAFFGINEREDIDPLSSNPVVTWKSSDFAGV